MTDRFFVRVPGSTSNLGPGFDCLGLAVDRYLELEWRSEGSGTTQHGQIPPAGFGNLLERPRARLGLPEEGALVVRSEIPVGRGLGSSAALRVALAALRSHLAGETPDRDRLLRTVAEDEGHPDNAAPALLGGLVAATIRPDGVDAIPLPFSSRIGLAFAAPATPVSTGDARGVLPARVDFEVAVRTVNRAIRLLPALASGDGARIAATLEDEIHVPARLGLIRGGESVRRAALEAGAWGCTVSGAGSGLISLGPVDRIEAVRDAMEAAFRSADPDGREMPAFVLRPELQGAGWGPERPPPVSPSRGPGGAPPVRRG